MDQFIRGALFQDDALVENISPVADTQGFPDVVVRDEHAQIPVSQVTDNVLDISHRQGVDAGKRLIQDDKVGGGDQGPGDLDPAPLTPGEGRGLLVGQVRNPQIGQQFLQAAPGAP